jgi:hypothetical protein
VATVSRQVLKDKLLSPWALPGIFKRGRQFGVEEQSENLLTDFLNLSHIRYFFGFSYSIWDKRIYFLKYV